MKKHLFILASLILTGFGAFAQNTANLIIFSEDGDPFYAFVNGVKQNNKAETNVKITGLSPNVSLRIEFENKALPQLKQVMTLDGGFEHSARIKRDLKKQLKLRYFGSVPLNESASGVPTVAYHTSEGEGSVNVETNPVTPPASTPVSGTNGKTTVTSSTTTTVRTTNKKPKPESENVSINMSVGEMGVNMNVSGTGMAEDGEVSTTTSSTTTVTRSSSSSSTIENDPPTKPQSNYNTTTTASKAGCSVAMSPTSFAKMKQSIESKPFSDTKMSTAKIATKSGCLSVSQVKEICKLFSMDDDKLAYAKYAYDYCIDKASYYEVSEVFSFSSTTDEFNKFLEK